MSNSCRLLEMESSLYKGLLTFTGNRNMANYIYAATKVPEFMSALKGVEYENGEPTFESLSRAIDLNEITEGKVTMLGEKQELGIVDSKGKPVEMEVNEAVDTAIDINQNNQQFVAEPQKKGDKYIINLEHKDDLNRVKPNLLVFNSALNNHLLGILRSLGFTAVEDAGIRHGIFDPTNAEKTLDGLITAIRIARGEEGEEAFPEEFSHLMIEGLQNTNIVSRYLNTITPEVAEAILGEDYDIYNEKYKGSQDLLRKEAAGKLLQTHITGNSIDFNYPNKSLLSRVWNFIKNILGKVSNSDIEDAINDAQSQAGAVANYILTQDLVSVIDRDAILNADTLYKTSSSIRRERDIANQALEVMSRRLNLMAMRSKEGRYEREDMETIKNMQEQIDMKKYAKSCFTFLNDTLAKVEQVDKRIKRLTKEDTRDSSDLKKIRRISMALRDIKEITEGYMPVVDELEEIEAYTENKETRLTEEDARKISEKAQQVNAITRHVARQYKNLRFQVVYNFLKQYWGEDKIIDIGKHKGTRVTLEGILKMAEKDINGTDRWISSLSAARDPLLTVFDKSVKVAQYKRDDILNSILPEIRAVHKKFADAGGNTSFMYERDEDGNLTGRLISDRDFVKFNRARREYIQKLKDEKLKSYQIKTRLEAWDRDNTEPFVLDAETGRTEALPKKSLYSSTALDKLSASEKEYYNQMIAFKRQLDNLLPARYVHTYHAVQIRNNTTEAVVDNITDPKKAAKTVLGNIKDNFIRRSDDTEFGESTKALLDFTGKPVNKLPVYYTSDLEDMSRLSTDFTSSIIAYAGMAVDYSEMNKIIDVLELSRDLINDREVAQLSGDQKIMESMKVLGKEIKNAYTRKGSESNIGARLDDYFESVIYKKNKKDEGTDIFGNKVDIAKSVDNLKAYTGEVGLGMNLFSGISNVTVGKMQIFIDAMSKEYFDLKDSAIGKKNYYALLPAYLGEINSTTKTNKLGLLIDKFDALGEFYEGLKDTNFYQNPMARMFGNTSLYILNNMGEHYLHSRTMLAILNRQKVKDSSGNKISLFDALEVEEIKDGSGNVLSGRLKLKDGVTKLDGSEFTEKDFVDVKMKIQRVNQSLNGAFNEADKGAIHRYCLGRLAMQFRQWMPEHYNRRFADTYYDAMMDQWREGYYRTVSRFMKDVGKDLIHAKFTLLTHWDELSESEKRNCYRALTEISMFATLAITCTAMGKAKDYKGVWWKRMLYYQLQRMKLETGASVPSLDLGDNFLSIVRSPAAAINTIDNILDLLKLHNMWVEHTSGRYKGWSEYEISLAKSLPIYGQARRVMDLGEEDYMFTMFNQK